VFSPDGRRILAAFDDNTARLWGGDGKMLATLPGPHRPGETAVHNSAQLG
jgi:hypothetical protein